jgi:hypothetical protein
VLGDGAKGDFGHRVDHTGGDQIYHVVGVGIGGVLHSGRGPQGTLRSRTEPCQRLPALAQEDLFVVLVGQPGVSDRRSTTKRSGLGCADLVQPRIDLSVHAGHEERGHRRDTGQIVSGVVRTFQTAQKRLHHRGRIAPGRRSA